MKYKGKNGLLKAQAELRKFKNEYRRVPTAHDKGMQSIASAAYRKY